MRTRLHSMMFVILSMVATPECSSLAVANESDENRYITKSRESLDLLRSNQFDKLRDRFDDTMKQSLSTEQLRQIWPGIQGAFGEYQHEVRSSVATAGRFTIVTTLLKFKSSAIEMTMSFDENGNIAGLFFKPSSEGTAYKVPGYVDQTRFTERDIVVTTGEFTLPGTITTPNGQGPFPGVVLVHGSGPNDKDETIYANKPFKDIAWGLASRGVAVIRYDKRTKKYAHAIDPSTLTIEQETVDDAVSAAQLLRKEESVGDDQVFILGHSLGAAAAPMIGQKDSAIAGLILLAAPARPLHELVEDQVVYISNADGVLSDAEKQQIKEVSAAVDSIKKGTAKKGDTLLGAPIEYWQRLDSLKTVDRAKTATIPIAVIHGGRDYQVTEKDWAIWKQVTSQNTNITVREFPRCNHLFHSADTPSTPAEYQLPKSVDQSVIEYVSEWIQRKVRKVSRNASDK